MKNLRRLLLTLARLMFGNFSKILCSNKTQKVSQSNDAALRLRGLFCCSQADLYNSPSAMIIIN